MKLFSQIGILLCIVVCLVGSCKKKEVNTPVSDVNTRIVEGRILLPFGAPTDLDGWVVASNYGETQVEGTNYKIEVARDEVDIQFLTNPEGKEVLIGVTYPGQQDYRISDVSTIIGLILKMPAVAALPTQNQVSLIGTIKMHYKFNETLGILATTLESGKSLLDPTNNILFERISELVRVAGMKTSEGEASVDIQTVGWVVKFQNPGVNFDQVAGIYRNGARLGKVNIKHAGGPNLTEAAFELPANDDYEVRIRSGQPGLPGNDTESKEALALNLTNFSLTNITHVLKRLESETNNSCITDLKNLIEGEAMKVAESFQVPAEDPSAALVSAVLSISSIGVDHLLSGNCEAMPPKSFLEKTLRLFKVIGIISSYNAGSISSERYQYNYVMRSGRLDTCLRAYGDNIIACSPGGQTVWSNTLSCFTIDGDSMYLGNDGRVLKKVMGSDMVTTVLTIPGNVEIIGIKRHTDGYFYLMTSWKDAGPNNTYVHHLYKWLPGATSGTILASGDSYSPSTPFWSLEYVSSIGIDVDASGNVYVPDVFGSQILKFSPGSTTGVTVAGKVNNSGSSANQLNQPNAVIVDNDGSLFIADNGNHRIQKWKVGESSGVTAAGGNGSGTLSNQFSNIRGLDLDATGTLYVSDNSRIQKWEPGAASGITIAGSSEQGSSPDQLSFPHEVYIHSDGSLYINDLGNLRIQRWVMD